MSDDKFIPGIHNYCDRWCERCAFTSRCRVAEAESAMTDEERDIRNEAFWRNLANIFAQAQTMIQEKAEELGIEIEPVSDEEFKKYKDRERAFVKSQEPARLAERYWRDARKTLENRDEWLIFSALDDETNAEMLAILNWYLFFIAAKIERGFHGLIDFDGTYLEEELDDPQSDANGSIKIALIAVERSIMAWTMLMTPENAPTIKPHLALLETIKQKTEQKFPLAPDFIRPGFDEVNEIVM